MWINENRRFSKQIALYLLTSVLVFVGVVSIWLGLIYYFDDDMTYQLSEYMITGNEERVREYLLEYRGEADGHNDAINFLAWGISHKSDFLMIVEGVDATHKVHLCERLGAAATDSGQMKEFEVAFQHHESECVKIILSDIIRHNEYLQRSKKKENK